MPKLSACGLRGGRATELDSLDPPWTLALVLLWRVHGFLPIWDRELALYTRLGRRLLVQLERVLGTSFDTS